MKRKSVLTIGIFVVLCILVNCVGKNIAAYFKLPLWMDSIGTIAVAYALGPVCGAIVGAAVNISYNFFDDMSLAYALVNILTGVIVGIMAKKGCFTSMFRAMTVGAVLALVSTVV